MKRLVSVVFVAVVACIAMTSCRRHYQRVWTMPAVDTLQHDDMEKPKTVDEIFNEPVMDIPEPPQEKDLRKPNSKKDKDELDEYFMSY
jgi:hypothetical protein